MQGCFRPMREYTICLLYTSFSLMSQYTPQPDAQGRLARRVTRTEYRAAAEYMRNCGIVDGFTQERTAAKEEYTPPFDLTGV